MELSKQEMELFLLVPVLESKKKFYIMFLTFDNEFKIGFKNRKWNYPNRKWNYKNRKWTYKNRKWNLFSYFQTSDQKTSFTKDFPSQPRTPKPYLGTGNGII